MFFKMKITLNKDVLLALRELPARAQRNMRRKMQTILVPELQADVDVLMSEDPGEVSAPFEFGTPKSRRKYFAMIDSGKVLTDGAHYIRQDIIERGFRVKISDRLREELLTVSNIQPKATFVYGPWQVAGHRNTGWGREFDVARQLLSERLHQRIYELWAEAVDEAAKSR